MCGIVAGNDSSYTREKIQNSLRLIERRGPDSSHIVYVDESRFLGFNLLGLASLDKETLKQPFQTEDKSISLCVNGEIYNYEELRSELEKRGCTFKTNSDCEVVMWGLKCYGKNYLSRLQGEFAIVAYFRDSNQWLCAVDHVGTKPLKYYISKNKFLVASSASALRPLGVAIELNLQSCLFTLHNGCVPRGCTLFNGVNTIPPGHFLEVRDDFSIEISPYEKSQVPSQNTFENLIEDAVRKRIPKYFRPALALSGGVDSSIIALILKDLGADFSCFSIDFPGSQYSELNEIEVFCQRHGLSRTNLAISEIDLIESFAESILNAENLVINTHSAAKLILNKAIYRAGHRVCFTGDGADELFWGYDHFHTNDDFQFVHDSNAIGLRYLEILNPHLKEQFLQSNLIHDSGLKSPNAQDLYYQYWLNEYGLKILGDSQAASQSIEYRYPFVDLELMCSAQNLKAQKKDNYPSKKILRCVLEKRDPELASRPKRPFTAPLITASWLPLFERYVFNERFEQIGIFDFDKLNAYVKRLSTHHLIDRPKASSILLSQILSLGILNQELCDG